MKGIDRRPKSKFSTGSDETKNSRSLSPNNVVIDGEVIDKERLLNVGEFKKMTLENIVEETDPVLQDFEFSLEDKTTSEPLELAVKTADENVQKFIRELSENRTNAREPIRKSSEEELRELTKLLSIIDANSKRKIVDTLINVYKSEILNCINNIAPGQISENQISSQQYKANSSAAKNPETKQVRFSDAHPSVNIHESQSQTEKESIEWAKYDYEGGLTRSNRSLDEGEHGASGNPRSDDHQLEQRLAKIQREHNDAKQLISAGVQAHGRTEMQAKFHNFDSRSDIESGSRVGHQVKLTRSKSDTALNQLKQRKKKQRKRNKAKKTAELTNSKKSSNVVQGLKNACLEQPETIQLRKNQLINYLDHELRTGNSSDQFSQVLFETANKLIENDLSSMEIPYGDPIQFGSFSPNYLLHTLKIASQSKTDVLPRIPLDYFATRCSDVSVSEEEYRKWLRQRNWTKYSFPNNTLPSIDNIYSISQTMTGEPLGEFGYYLEKENALPGPTASESNSFLGDFAETFLYEQVVISKAMNFFLTFNAKRTRVLSKRDRCVQVLFFGLFYSIWVFMDTYILMDAKSKKGLWK